MMQSFTFFSLFWHPNCLCKTTIDVIGCIKNIILRFYNFITTTSLFCFSYKDIVLIINLTVCFHFAKLFYQFCNHLLYPQDKNIHSNESSKTRDCQYHDCQHPLKVNSKSRQRLTNIQNMLILCPQCGPHQSLIKGTSDQKFTALPLLLSQRHLHNWQKILRSLA